MSNVPNSERFTLFWTPHKTANFKARNETE